MRARLDHLAVLEHDDHVGPADGREPVGDDERRPVAQERLEGVLDARLGRDVDRRRRLVEDQDPRVGEERAGEGDQLALADREPRAALLDVRVVAVRAGRWMNSWAPDGARRRTDLVIGRAGPAEADVVADRAGEEEPSCGTIPSCRRSVDIVTSRRSARRS